MAACIKQVILSLWSAVSAKWGTWTKRLTGSWCLESGFSCRETPVAFASQCPRKQEVSLEWFMEILMQNSLTKWGQGLRKLISPGPATGGILTIPQFLRTREGAATTSWQEFYMSLKVMDRRCDLGERNSYCQAMPGLSLLYSHLSSASHSPNPTRTHRRGNLLMQSMSIQPPGVKCKVGKI